MLVMLVVGRELFPIKDPVSSQVRVSDAHVVRMVDHSSANETLAVFVIEPDGFVVLVIAISTETYSLHTKASVYVFISVAGKVLFHLLCFFLQFCTECLKVGETKRKRAVISRRDYETAVEKG